LPEEKFFLRRGLFGFCGRSQSSAEGKEGENEKVSHFAGDFFMKTSMSSHSAERSVQRAGGGLFWCRPEPAAPFVLICGLTDFLAAVHFSYRATLSGARPRLSSVAAAMNMGGASAGTGSSLRRPAAA